MTFEEFQASQEDMTSHQFGELIGDARWDDALAKTFYVYAGQYWIEVEPDHKGGGYNLILEREEWSVPASELESLERRLYQWAADDNGWPRVVCVVCGARTTIKDTPDGSQCADCYEELGEATDEPMSGEAIIEFQEELKTYAHSPDACPSNHWNDGNDICEDCGADLNDCEPESDEAIRERGDELLTRSAPRWAWELIDAALSDVIDNAHGARTDRDYLDNVGSATDAMKAGEA